MMVEYIWIDWFNKPLDRPRPAFSEEGVIDLWARVDDGTSGGEHVTALNQARGRERKLSVVGPIYGRPFARGHGAA